MMKRLSIVLIFLLLSFISFAKKKLQTIPQRIIFFENTTDVSQYSNYVNYLVESVCSSLDSKLDIRFMKSEEYDKYNYLLSDMTSDNLRKFYSKTNVRGIITTSVIEKETIIKIIISVYELYNDKVTIKDIELKKNSFYSQIENFPVFISNLITKVFPKIEPKIISRDKLRLVKLIRNAPDYAINIWGGLGYNGKNFHRQLYVADPSGTGPDIEEDPDGVIINGIAINVGVEAKIKRFFISGSINFTPYIASGLKPSIISTGLKAGNIFWFDLIGNIDFGLFFVGDILRLDISCNIGELSNYSFYSTLSDPFNTAKFSDDVLRGLTVIPLFGITAKPLPNIEFGIYYGAGPMWFRYDIHYLTVIIHSEVNTKFYLTKKIFLMFNFFVEMTVVDSFPLQKEEYYNNYWKDNKGDNYQYGTQRSGVFIGLGYNFDIPPHTRLGDRK